MAIDYDVIVLDLAAGPYNRQSVVPRGLAVAEVSINALPFPAVGLAMLHFGQGPGIPLRFEGVGYKRTPADTDGIFVTSPAVAGSLELLIGFGSLSTER